MGTQAFTDSQLKELEKCVSNGRLGDSILFASSALFFFEYFLTVFDEVKLLRRSKRLSLGVVLFVVSRYCALLAAILAISPARHDMVVDTVGTVLRLIAIVASEFILATRTWAIWAGNRKILWVLIIFSLGMATPAAVVIAKSLASNTVRPLITPELAYLCSATVGDIPWAFIVPYVLAIIYEFVTLSLSLFRIAKWRKSIPEHIRAPLLDTLWRDGVLYFTFMLLLSFMNISLVLQSEAPQLRTSGGNLQAVLHSSVAVRIVLQLAISSNPRDITNAAISGYHESITDIQFSTTPPTDRTVDRFSVLRLEENEDK